MEATKKVGGPDPSGPQGHPLSSSQQQRGGLRGSQGPWMNSKSLSSKQALSQSTGAIADMACSPNSQASMPQPIHQLLQDHAQASSRCNCVQDSQDAPKLSSTDEFSSPVLGTEQRLMDDGTQTLPMCTYNDSASYKAQGRLSLSRLQLHMEKENKAPAKVLVGWGKGTCNIDQLPPRKSRWLPYLLSEQGSRIEGQNPLLTRAQTPAQDPGQGKCPGLAQSPSPTTTSSSLVLSSPTPGQAALQTPNATSTPAVVEPYTCPDFQTDTTTIMKGLSQDLLRNGGNQLSTISESSKVVSSSQDKINVHLKKVPPTPTPTPILSSPPQEYPSSRKQSPSKHSEDAARKSPIYTSRPDILTPGTEPPCALNTERSIQKFFTSQPDKQYPDGCNSNNCSNVPLPAYQVTCSKHLTSQSSHEATQIPASSAPNCQLQDAVEDHVLVFDMATGNTRMGLLCHDPMGSRAVLVGLSPIHPSIYVPESMLSSRSLPKPVVSPKSNHSSFWSTTATLSSPVPSSLSTGSYREVALVPKEAKHNLESHNSPGTQSPMRVGMLTRSPQPGTPLQFGEKILAQTPDPRWPKSDVEKNDPSHTIWMLGSPGMPDTSMVQSKKLQWIKSEPAPTADIQVVSRSLQEELSNHNQKEIIAAHPDSCHTKDAGQVFLTGQTFLNGQNILSRQLPVTDQGPLSSQLPSTKQLPLTTLPPIAEQTPLSRQFSFTEQVPIPVKPSVTKGLTHSPGDSVQPSTQGSEPLGIPSHVGILRIPLTPEETCIYVNRNKTGMSSVQNASTHQVPSWQLGNSHRSHQKQLSVVTFTGAKDLPMAMMSPEPQNGHRFKLAAEDITRSSVVAHLGLLRGNCYELVSTMDALPVQSPVVCHHSSGPYQNMAAIVIDTGTGFTKCGLAGEDHILSVVPSQVQMLQHPTQGQPQYVVPENHEGSYSVLNRGVVSDWDALEVLWQHLFYCKLKVQPEEMTVLVADSPISPRTNREKVAEILFERFHVPAMQTAHQALLTLYAYGRTTGLVVGSGHGTSYVAPIITGDLAPLDTYRLDVAGADLTNYLAQLLLASGNSPHKTGLVNQIKEACCCVAMDMAAEMAHNQSQAKVDFMLPDKQVITLGSERFCCPEPLFQPSLLGLSQPGLPQLALLSISRLEAKQQEELLANVVLEGGSTLVSGFPERLRQELGPGATVLSSPHRAVAAWLGGSIMACRDSFQSLWLSRREYEEEGPWAIYKYQL